MGYGDAGRRGTVGSLVTALYSFQRYYRRSIHRLWKDRARVTKDQLQRVVANRMGQTVRALSTFRARPRLNMCMSWGRSRRRSKRKFGQPKTPCRSGRHGRFSSTTAPKRAGCCDGCSCHASTSPTPPQCRHGVATEHSKACPRNQTRRSHLFQHLDRPVAVRHSNRLLELAEQTVAR